MAGKTEAGSRFRTEYRLHRPEEFAAVMASPLRLHEACFELRYRRNESAPGQEGQEGHERNGARLGVIVPKRLAGRAVLRNLLKRLGREAFRHARPRLPAIDIVLRLVKSPMPAGEKADRLRRESWRRTLDALLAKVAQ